MSEVREPLPRPARPGRLTVWVDAHVSPAIARWLGERFGVDARSAVSLGLEHLSDHALFDLARGAEVDALLTKDSDFATIFRRRGIPPCVIVLACGNRSNTEMRAVLDATFERALSHVRRGQPIVEIDSTR